MTWKKGQSGNRNGRPRKYDNVCSAPGCDRKHRSKGLCDTHWNQMRTRGFISPIRTKGCDGGGYINSNGYRLVGHKYEHIIIAETVLGRPLPKGACIHHVNGNRLDNRPDNLVICPSKAYHQTIEKRNRAYKACGHADWLKCNRCKQWDSPQNMHVNARSYTQHHFNCKGI